MREDILRRKKELLHSILQQTPQRYILIIPLKKVPIWNLFWPCTMLSNLNVKLLSKYTHKTFHMDIIVEMLYVLLSLILISHSSRMFKTSYALEYHPGSVLLMVGRDYLVEKLAWEERFKNILEYYAQTTTDYSEVIYHICSSIQLLKQRSYFHVWHIIVEKI
jgi:hypothetical protein